MNLSHIPDAHVLLYQYLTTYLLWEEYPSLRLHPGAAIRQAFSPDMAAQVQFSHTYTHAQFQSMIYYNEAFYTSSLSPFYHPSSSLTWQSARVSKGKKNLVNPEHCQLPHLPIMDHPHLTARLPTASQILSSPTYILLLHSTCY